MKIGLIYFLFVCFLFFISVLEQFILSYFYFIETFSARGQKIKNKKKAYPSTQRVYKVNSEALEHSFMPPTSNISNIS